MFLKLYVLVLKLNYSFSVLSVYVCFFGKRKLSHKKLSIKCWWIWLQKSISPTFYAQRLHMQNPKAQKRLMACLYFALLGSACIKALHKTLMKLNPDHNLVAIFFFVKFKVGRFSRSFTLSSLSVQCFSSDYIFCHSNILFNYNHPTF